MDHGFDAGETRVVDLVNPATKNEQLVPWCGRSMVLFVHVLGTGDPSDEFPEEPAKANVTRPTYLTVACP